MCMKADPRCEDVLDVHARCRYVHNVSSQDRVHAATTVLHA